MRDTLKQLGIVMAGLFIYEVICHVFYTYALGLSIQALGLGM